MEWAPQFDVDEDLAQQLISGQFPGIACKSVSRLGAGMDNVAYLIDERYVFRFPRRDWVVALLEREQHILPVIADRLPLRIPFPQYMGNPGLGYPWSFAGYERLDGTTACSISSTVEDRVAMARPLGKFLRALHHIDAQIGERAGLPGDELGRLDHAQRFPLVQDRFAELEREGLISDSSPFLAFLEMHAPGEPRNVRCIVHGDLYARHLLVDERHALCGVIDWGDTHLGDPAVDLMIAHTMLPAVAHDAFIDAYGGADEQTWMLAKYRAVYHSALVAHFGVRIGDRALRDAGMSALALMFPEGGAPLLQP